MTCSVSREMVLVITVHAAPNGVSCTGSAYPGEKKLCGLSRVQLECMAGAGLDMAGDVAAKLKTV